MKRLLIGVAAAALLAAPTPAYVQVYLGAEPGGVGVQAGPLGVGVGPDYWGAPYWRHHHWREDYAYGRECRVVRQRIVTRHGHIIWHTRRDCD